MTRGKERDRGGKCKVKMKKHGEKYVEYKNKNV